MEPVLINRRSWHFRLSYYMNDGYVGVDTCSYVGQFGKALVKLFFIAALVVTLIAVLLVLPLWATWFTISQGGLVDAAHSLYDLQTTGLAVVAAYIFLLFYVLYGTFRLYRKKVLELHLKNSTLRSLVTDRVWNKVCRPVKFK